jgi:hypothetical protein
MFVNLISIVKSISVSCQADAKSSHSATNSHTLSPIVRPYRVMVFGIVPFLIWIQYPPAAASKQQPATISTQAAGSQQPASSSRGQCHGFWDRLIFAVYSVPAAAGGTQQAASSNHQHAASSQPAASQQPASSQPAVSQQPASSRRGQQRQVAASLLARGPPTLGILRGRFLPPNRRLVPGFTPSGAPQ